MEEIASRARCGDDRKIAGFAVKRIIAAVFSVVPGNLRIADAGQIGIHHALLVVDSDLPSRAAGRIGAANGSFMRLRFSNCRGNGYAHCQGGDSRRWTKVWEHGRLSLAVPAP